MLRPKIFNNQPEVLVAIADSSDGVFGISAWPQSPAQAAARQAFWRKSGVLPASVSVLNPRGGKILVLDRVSPVVKAQGAMTYRPQTFLALLTADCPAAVFYDKRQKIVGLLHLGWWQTYHYLLKDFWLKWQNHYHSNLHDLRIFIGPAICGQCYKMVGWRGWLRIVLFSFSPWRQFLIKEKNKYSLDLKGVILQQSLAQGFKRENIEISPFCTFTEVNLPSYRREGRRRQSSLLTIAGMRD